jgi:thymidylate synthase ThyX
MKNQISAEIIADSINGTGQRITSFLLVFPRIVLAEFNTHRMLSRNSASSRAIPFETMLSRLKLEPFVPIKFQKDHSGMQGTEYFEGSELEEAQNVWVEASRQASMIAKAMNMVGITKQLCNRLLEPFMYHTVIVTGTEWENFFSLRAHPAAEIHIADLAEKMLNRYNKSTPKVLKSGEWHIPFGGKMDYTRLCEVLVSDGTSGLTGSKHAEALEKLQVKIATARCARVSYLNYEGNDDYFADVKLHNMLSGSGHWSPFEHCAQAMSANEMETYMSTPTPGKLEGGWCGNFKGFIQYRKTFVGENAPDVRLIKK